MTLNGETNLTRWRNYIETVVMHINTRPLKGKIPGESDIVRPIDLNIRNCGKYVEYLLFNKRAFFQSLHPFLIPEKDPESVFKFKIGDEVYLAKKLDKKAIREAYKFETRSLGGHFARFNPDRTENKYIVVNRRLETSSQGYLLPIYDIEQEDININHVYEIYLRDFPKEKQKGMII